MSGEGQNTDLPGTNLGGGCRGCAPLPEMTYGFLIQLVFSKKMWFIGISYAILSGAPPPKKNPGSAPASNPWTIQKESLK